MSLKMVNGRAVHFPKGEKFEWDEEVAAVFPDMARRSIPLYRQMHELHAMIVLRAARERCGCEERKDLFTYRVADVGASYGEFLRCIQDNRHLAGEAKLSLSAYEPSRHMRTAIEHHVPGAYVYEHALGGNEIGCKGGFDAVACHYTLQFVPEEKQLWAINELKDMVAPGGIFLFAQKDDYQDFIPQFIKGPVSDHYLQFRRDNGYSDQEIAEKTRALKGAMNTMPASQIRHLIRPGFTIMADTVRMGQFGAFVAVKDV